MKIRTVDPFDDEEFERWHAVYFAARTRGRPYPTAWPLHDCREMFRRPDKGRRHELIAAYDGDEIVGTNWLCYPLLDNLNTVYADPAVHPEKRERGAGSALIDDMLDRMRAEGRSISTAEVDCPYGEDWTAVALQSRDVQFALRRGFELASTEVHRVLGLPVADQQLDELAEQAAPHHAGYDLVTWGNACPDEHLAEFCRLYGLLGVEAPTGTLEVEEEVWDGERMRAIEATRAASGRAAVTAAAIARDGVMAGYTMMAVSMHDPGVVYQWGTLVRPEHRGHRLGIALKVATARALQRQYPEAKLAHTWNAGVNRPMVAVNEALGFQPVEVMAELQLRL